MEFYYSKKKIFKSFLSWLTVLVVLLLPVIFVFNFTEEAKEDDPLMIFPLLIFVPLILIVLVFVLKYLYKILMPSKLALKVDEEGIVMKTSNKYKVVGLIKWSEVAYIKESTDNMNRAAIRITLKGHIMGQYLFYFSNKDAKKTDYSVSEVWDVMNKYYLESKNI